MKDLVLISNENFIGLPNKNNRQNKNRKFYEQQLERFFEDRGFGEVCMDITPMRPIDNGIQNFKSEIISELNSRNVFDFPYCPKEQDTLRITNLKNLYDYLYLQFLNNKWGEFRNMTFSERYQPVREGKFELK